MSLLYECINGVIQGGILDGAENASEGDKIANLCVDRLRGMIIVEGDPNREVFTCDYWDLLLTSASQICGPSCFQ